MINTRFWIDDYISNLDPSEKLLFLYFLTNPYTEICGIYELPLKHVAMETGLDKEMVVKILARFEKDKKIIYKNGWVGIYNFAKHQVDNPKVHRGIEIGLAKAPKEIVDRLSIGHDSLSHSNSNSNPNSNKIDIDEVIDSFKLVTPSYKRFFPNKTQRAAVERLLETQTKDSLIKVISNLPRTNVMPYMPVIASPVQLEEKWTSLKAALQKSLNKKEDEK